MVLTGRLWSSIFFIMTISRTQVTADVTIASSQTLDVEVRCHLSAFVERSSPDVLRNLKSLQVIQHAISSQSQTDVLATLDPEKGFIPSSFLQSNSRSHLLSGAYLSDGDSWLSVVMADVKVHTGELFFQCRGAYGTPVNDDALSFWHSESVLLSLNGTDTRLPEIQVTTSRGLALECRFQAAEAHSMRTMTLVERLELNRMVIRNLCLGGEESRAVCSFTEPRSESEGSIIIHRAHLLNVECEDEGTYFCRLATTPRPEAPTLQVRFPQCSVASQLDFDEESKRVHLSVLIFAAAILFILLIVFRIRWLLFSNSIEQEARKNT